MSTKTTQESTTQARKSANIYAEVFGTFLRIGLFTIGGGYAMLPLIQSEVVERRKWIDERQFVDLVAMAQSCPGVFAVNMSVFIGYKLRQLRGAICATLGTVLPSLVIILLVAMFFRCIQDNPTIEAIFRGIRPAVVALIAAPVFSMARTARITLTNCWIPVAAALLIWLFGVNPVYIILAAAVGGYLYGTLIKPTE